MCDRFRLADMQDAVGGRMRIVPRVTALVGSGRRHPGAAAVRARWAVIGRAGIADLIAASLAAATVKTDDQGSVRLVKRGTNNQARDDVAAALTLAAGALARGCPRRGRCAGPSSGRPNGPQSSISRRFPRRVTWAASEQTYFAPRRDTGAGHAADLAGR